MDRKNKKKYVEPQLRRYGSLKALTRGGGGTKKDTGTGRKTKTTAG